MKPFITTAMLIAATAALTGCGINGLNAEGRAPLGSYQTRGASSDPGDEDPDYACPASSNINPDYDTELDGSGFYTACPSRTDYFKVKIHGRTSRSSQICVVPAEYIDQDTIYLKPESVGGAPQVRCLDVSQGPVIADFPHTRYNAFFIVESQHREQMMACLPAGNYYNCPAYSFGVFR